MLDIKYIREHPEKMKQNIKNRGLDPKRADVDRLLEMDQRRRTLLVKSEKLREERNKISQKIGAGRPADEERRKLVERGREVKAEIKKVETELRVAKREFQSLMDWMPNVASPEMPLGKSAAENVELCAWIPRVGYLKRGNLGRGSFSARFMPKTPIHAEGGNFSLKDHVELGESLKLVDVQQSALVSGSRFCYLLNEAVLLQDALYLFLREKLLKESFVPMIPPVLVKEKTLYGTSHFPAGRDQVYKLEKEYLEAGNELYLVGSSEPSIFAYFMDKTLERKDLPIKVFAYTTCFRSEVGSWGKDVRGIKRVHQFDKLEMDVITTQESSLEMMEYLRGINEWFLQRLELPYRIVNKCTADAGYLASYKQYDVDVWLPSQKEYMEVMTNTDAGDFQSRRLNIRYESGGQIKHTHTINDTGCALGRTIIAILDNYQQADGSVKIPKVLQKYVGKKVIKPRE